MRKKGVNSGKRFRVQPKSLPIRRVPRADRVALRLPRRIPIAEHLADIALRHRLAVPVACVMFIPLLMEIARRIILWAFPAPPDNTALIRAEEVVRRWEELRRQEAREIMDERLPQRDAPARGGFDDDPLMSQDVGGISNERV